MGGWVGPCVCACVCLPGCVRCVCGGAGWVGGWVHACGCACARVYVPACVCVLGIVCVCTPPPPQWCYNGGTGRQAKVLSGVFFGARWGQIPVCTCIRKCRGVLTTFEGGVGNFPTPPPAPTLNNPPGEPNLPGGRNFPVEGNFPGEHNFPGEV